MLKPKTTTKLPTAVALLFAWSNIGSSGCNITLPWDPGTTSPSCPTMGQGGAGGDNGAGGAGGGDDGVGGAPGAGVGGTPGSGAGVGAGSGNVSSAAVSAGAGPGDGAGGGAAPGMMRTAGGHPRHVRRHHKEPIGTAAQADCPEPAVPLMMIPKPPVPVGLTTTKLRAIAAYLKIGAGLTGVQLNRESSSRTGT
jgi:hypothetical protein